MKKKFVLCDTREFISYESYLEYCELNNRVPQSDQSDDYYVFCHEMQMQEWEDFITNVVYCRFNSYDWIITGALGLWNGNYEVDPTVEPSLEDALTACVDGSIMDVKVEKMGSVLYVSAYHHDGCNNFEIRALTDIGSERFNRNGEVSLLNKENVATLPDHLF